VKYTPSLLTGNDQWQLLAPGFTIGMRFHSAPVIRLADAKPMHLGHTLKADARWHLFAFAADEDPSAHDCRLARLVDFLENDPGSPLRRYTPLGADCDTVIDFRAIMQQGFRTLQVSDLPKLCWPQKGRFGLVDYEKAFCADQRSGTDIFDMRQIDRQHGCLIIVRPDQYVADIMPLDAFERLSAFFDGFLLPTSTNG
jgi:phenol 2-monooxygenase